MEEGHGHRVYCELTWGNVLTWILRWLSCSYSQYIGRSLFWGCVCSCACMSACVCMFTSVHVYVRACMGRPEVKLWCHFSEATYLVGRGRRASCSRSSLTPSWNYLIPVLSIFMPLHLKHQDPSNNLNMYLPQCPRQLAFL